MLKMLPKSMIINHIVETLTKDPEAGVSALLEKITVKTPEEQALVNTVMNFYANSHPAKMQIKNLVFNTPKPTLKLFAENIYNSLQKVPITVDFLRGITMEQASKLTSPQRIFPVIDLKNLNDAVITELTRLKNQGFILMASILVTDENLHIVTSDETVVTLIRTGIRGLLYRSDGLSKESQQQLHTAIHRIRLSRPLLAFYMKKDDLLNKPSCYVIEEQMGDKIYRLNLVL